MRHNLELAAALIAESRRSQWVDYAAVKERERVSDPETQKILSKLKSMVGDGMSPDLVATACCAALRLGPRIRRYRRLREHNLRPFWIVERLKRLKRKLPKLTEEQIHEALRQNPDFRWVRALLAGERVGQNERGSTVCVSKVFPNISRKMASYYRRSDPKRFALVVEELRTIAELTNE
jgi:hypothetical protein